MKRELSAFIKRIVLAALVFAITSLELFGQTDDRKKHALVVGINKYFQTYDLRYAVSAAKEIAVVLEQAGFEVTVVTDDTGKDDAKRGPTKVNIETKLKEIVTKRCREDKGDMVLIVLIGHGVHINGEQFFCPNDASNTKEDTMISFSWIYETLDDSFAGPKLLLVDACRDHPKMGETPEYAKPPLGFGAIFSCEAGQRAFDDDSLKQPLFSYFVLKALKGEAKEAKDVKGQVTFHSLGEYVGEQVSKKAKELKLKQKPAMVTTTWVRHVLTQFPPTLPPKEVEKPQNETLIRLGKNFREGISDFSKKVRDTLDAQLEPENSVTVEPFVVPVELASNPGPLLYKLLEEELKKNDVLIKKEASLKISGKIIFPDAKDSKNVEVQMSIGPRKISYSLKKMVEEERDKLFPPPNAGKKSKIHGRFGTEPYFFEIRVKGEGGKEHMLPIKEIDGVFGVDLKRGQRYVVRLINDSGHEAAVRVLIDGLNCFSFSEDPGDSERDYRVLVKKNEPFDVSGWYVRRDRTLEFEVCDYAKSGAKLMNRSTNSVGTITAQFYASWNPGDSPPPGESEPFVLRGDNATGFGKGFVQEWTIERRVVGRLRATIALRY